MTAERYPTISVVMPTYNGESHLRAAFDSLESQKPSGVPFEVLVSDDGSSDATLHILKEATERLPLRVIDGPRKRNWVASTNALLREARGEYVTMLHQDDIYFPERFAELASTAAAYPNISVFSHPTRFINSAGRAVGTWKPPMPTGKRLSPHMWFPPLMVQNNFAVPAMMFRRRLSDELGDMDETLPYTADWEYWLRFAASERIFILPKPLAGFRIHGASQTVAFAEKADEYERNLREVVVRSERTASRLNLKKRYIEMARFGVDVNLWLAAKASGRSFPVSKVLGGVFDVGLPGAFSYISLSRMIPRSLARLRAGRS